MSAASAMFRGRVIAESLMVDTCTVGSVTGTTTDDMTGEVIDVITSRYAGRCKVQSSLVGGNRAEVGEHSALVLRLELHLPMVGSESVNRGDVVVITASAYDTALAGRRFILRDLAHKTYLTARRFGMEEAT